MRESGVGDGSHVAEPAWHGAGSPATKHDDANNPLIAGIILGGAFILGVIAILCWTNVIFIDHGQRQTIAFAFGLAAAGDLLVGLYFLTRARHA